MSQLAHDGQTGTHPLAARIRGWGYEVHDQLGAGAMGLVYRGRNPTLGREVAIKFIREDLAQSAPFVRAFLREARIGAKIDHPNVTSVLDFGRADDGRCFIVMELLQGHALSEILDAHRTPPLVWSVQVVAELMSGLAAAHDEGVIHADIKPENIFVNTRKTDWGQTADRVKLCDFGIARVGREVDEIALCGKICGTPGYMSPEQWLGLQVDPRSDVYSAGVVLYELLAGRLPYDVTEESPTTAQVARVPEAPSAVRSQVCASLDAVVLRAMATAPERRYQSARAMRSALLACLNDLVPCSTDAEHAPLAIHPLVVAGHPPVAASDEPRPHAGDTGASSAHELGVNATGVESVARAVLPGRGARAIRFLGLAAVAAGAGLALMGTLGAVDPWWWVQHMWRVASEAQWSLR